MAPTVSADRVCQRCSLGTTFSRGGVGPCRLVRGPCSTGEEAETPPTAASDRLCAPCSPGTMASTRTTPPTCEPCPPGCAACNASSSCLQCAAGMLMAADNNLCSDECALGSYAPPGARLCTKCASSCHRCTGPLQGDCTACPPGLFLLPTTSTAGDGGHRCVSDCTPTRYKSRDTSECTLRRVCDPLTQWQALADHGSESASFADTDCRPVRACLRGEYIQAPHTAASDRMCARCAVGQYDHDSDAATPCQPCPPGYASSIPGAFSCRPCEPDTFQQLSGQKQCNACSYGRTCEGGATFLLTCSRTADTSCLPCSSCDRRGVYEVRPCTVASDTVCKECTLCPAGVTYATTDCLSTSDRTCQPCTLCARGETETAACTPTSDRACTNTAMSDAESSSIVGITGIATGATVAVVVLIAFLVMVCMFFRKQNTVQPDSEPELKRQIADIDRRLQAVTQV